MGTDYEFLYWCYMDNYEFKLRKPEQACAGRLSCVQLFATSWTSPGSSVHGVLQARTRVSCHVLFQ